MGKIPELDKLYENDKKIISRLIKFPKIIGSSIENFKFRDGCFEMMNLARMGNKFLADEEPWKKIKSNPQRVKTIINLSAQIAATLSIVCEPFLPFTSIKLKSLLKIEKKIKWNQLSENYILLKDQHEINKPILLFDKIDDEEIELQIKNLKGLN
jgi:methionyl-tRNA synthetase